MQDLYNFDDKIGEDTDHGYQLLIIINMPAASKEITLKPFGAISSIVILVHKVRLGFRMP